MDVNTLGGLDGLTWLSSTAVAARGIEVWALDPDQVGRAILLLEEHKAEVAGRAAQPATADAPIRVTCEDCSGVSTFPHRERGTVQNCNHCGAYVDVPGDEEDIPPEHGEAEEDA